MLILLITEDIMQSKDSINLYLSDNQ